MSKVKDVIKEAVKRSPYYWYLNTCLKYGLLIINGVIALCGAGILITAFVFFMDTDLRIAMLNNVIFLNKLGSDVITKLADLGKEDIFIKVVMVVGTVILVLGLLGVFAAMHQKSLIFKKILLVAHSSLTIALAVGILGFAIRFRVDELLMEDIFTLYFKSLRDEITTAVSMTDRWSEACNFFQDRTKEDSKLRCCGVYQVDRETTKIKGNKFINKYKKEMTTDCQLTNCWKEDDYSIAGQRTCPQLFNAEFADKRSIVVWILLSLSIVQAANFGFALAAVISVFKKKPAEVVEEEEKEDAEQGKEDSIETDEEGKDEPGKDELDKEEKDELDKEGKDEPADNDEDADGRQNLEEEENNPKPHKQTR